MSASFASRPGFSVPAEVRHLGSEQLALLTDAFRSWYREASRPTERRARGRVWLAFLVIRYTGAKLGEVIAIDDRSDLDASMGVLRLRGREAGGTDRSTRAAGPPGRVVQLPVDVVGELRAYLKDPGNASLRGRVFRLDQGFVRRKFYERADACGIPRDLASPQALRASRTVELLRGGMPLPVVQRVLGQGSANLTARIVDYEPGDVSRIFEAYLLSELRTRTSARNLFAGRVSRLVRGEILSEVTLETAEGQTIVSVITNTSLDNLGLGPGAPATALIKAPSVMVVRGEEPPCASARNVLRGTVTAVRSDAVMAEVIVALAGGTEVCALITAASAGRLALAVGEPVWALFDTAAVILTVARLD